MLRMDQAHDLQHKPSMSRIPLARALTPIIHQDEHQKQSHLPRPSANQARKLIIKPLGETNTTAIRANGVQHERTSSRVLSSVKASFGFIHHFGLENAPPVPELTTPVSVEDDKAQGYDNFKVTEDVTEKRRRHRPSLSERTMESLSRVSPTRSPSRKRSITVTSNSSMGPPTCATSSMNSSRPTTPPISSAFRSVSPTKRPFRPPGRSLSPTKDIASMPLAESIYTPPRAFLRGSRLGKPSIIGQRTVSTVLTTRGDDSTIHRPTQQASKVKSLYNLRAEASRQLSSKPSLPNLSGSDMPSESTPQRRSSFQQTSPQTGFLKARQPGDNVIASGIKAPTPHVKMITPAKRLPRPKTCAVESRKQEIAAENAKSSAALRETIAKAKAARRYGLGKSEMCPDRDMPGVEISLPDRDDFVVEFGSNSMKKKLENAVVSGVLNLSALSLKELPNEVISMYDFKEGSKISWAEAVDLKKLLVADNEIREFSDDFFPDWSVDEMMEDAEKNNQFAGLETLDAHGNQLKTLPIGVRRLLNLRTLNLSNNGLKFDCFHSFYPLQNLRELRLAGNGLAGTLPAEIGDMVNLQTLDLRNNSLTCLPSSISRLTNLQRLLLGSNQLSSVSFDHLPFESLIELDMSKNVLKGAWTEHFGLLQKLQILNLSSNSLETMYAGKLVLPALHTLLIDFNKLTVLPDLSQCNQLSTLTASENSLSSISESLTELVQLRNVDLSSNDIKTVDSFIMTMDNLVMLNLAGNPLREKKYLTMNLADIRADMLKKSAPVVLHNAVEHAQQEPSLFTEVSQPAVKTQTLFVPKSGILDLSSQSLTSLSPADIDLSTTIHTLRLANNDLTSFPVALLNHPKVKWTLKSLDLSHIPSLHSTDYLAEEIHLPVLQSLYIVSTGLATLDNLTTYLNAPELRELNISCHRLTGHVPWVRAWYPQCTTLLASDNWFDSIDVEGVRGLEVLDISNNEIENLPCKLGLLGNHAGKSEPGKLRSFECAGNRFRVPRLVVVEKGTEAVLKDLRRMIAVEEVPEEWAGEV